MHHAALDCDDNKAAAATAAGGSAISRLVHLLKGNVANMKCWATAASESLGRGKSAAAAAARQQIADADRAAELVEMLSCARQLETVRTLVLSWIACDSPAATAPQFMTALITAIND